MLGVFFMWNFNNDKPVYVQIIDEIMMRITSGVYKPGERIPSVRELAEEARVNPNTMQKALYEIERDGYLISLRTSGKYVTEDVQLIQSFRDSRAEKTIAMFAAEMERLGISKEETLEKLRDYCSGEQTN